MGAAFSIDVSDASSHGQQGCMVEGCQADLDRAGVVEATVGAEVDVKTLGQRRKALHALGAVEECRCARDDQIEAGIPPRIDLVDPLPESVQSLLAGVGAHALQRFHLVQHHDQTGVAAVAQDGEQAHQEVRGAEMIEVTLDARCALDAGCHVRLPRQPADETVRQHAIPGRQSAPVGAQHGRERRGGLADSGNARLHQRIGARQQFLGVVGIHRRVGQNILLQCIEPAIDDTAESAAGGVCRAQVFDKSAVDRLQAVQRRFGLVDLDFRRRKAAGARPLLQPTPEEGLAGAVLAAYGLESAAAGGDRCQLLVEGGRERFDSHCERVQPAARHGAATQGTDDVFPPCGADHR